MSVVIRDLHYTHYAGTPMAAPALRGVTLRIEAGSLTAVIGRTGSGKSTLLQHLVGLMRPAPGTLLIDGVDVGAERTDLKALRRKVGLTFQYPEDQLFGATVFEDVAFGPRQAALPKGKVERRVEQALMDVGLSTPDVADRSPFELSGGQRRRVALAGVLAMRPKILALDEPTAGLDGSGRLGLMERIVRLHGEQRITVLWVTHSMEDAALLADHLVVLSEGRVAMEGTPERVFAREDELLELGLGIPAHARLMRRLREAGMQVPPYVRSAAEAADAIVRAGEATG